MTRGQGRRVHIPRRTQPTTSVARGFAARAGRKSCPGNWRPHIMCVPGDQRGSTTASHRMQSVRYARNILVYYSMVGGCGPTELRYPHERMRRSVQPAGRESDPLPWKGTSRYEVVRCIGHGGMGVVYEAYDRECDRRVAIKTLLRFSPSALYLFKQEFRTLANVLHRNLVRLHELVASESDGVFFTMELVSGAGLRDIHAAARRPRGARIPPAATRWDGAATARAGQRTRRVEMGVRAPGRSPPRAGRTTRGPALA